MALDPDQLTEGRYLGKVCEKHPILNGLRRKKTSECIGCRRERAHLWSKTNPARQVRIRERKRDLREMDKIATLQERRVLDAIRVKACELASARVRNVSRWQEFYDEARQLLENSNG